ncbi:hypothetical protein CMI38_02445 [Candidatus Pacearchaeota archaeon]|jgi:hypothetical protein|nr:hypothetical protein [Candidatus Pacearchaeota archaeon]|tara:strand:- start:542 stop:721 length:180 start_codon:yes stop_codon:yes gene_type:complete
MKSQTILGIIFIIVGIILTVTLIGAVWGVPLIIIGIFLIIFRNEESKIESIKIKGGKKR